MSSLLYNGRSWFGCRPSGWPALISYSKNWLPLVDALRNFVFDPTPDFVALIHGLRLIHFRVWGLVEAAARLPSAVRREMESSEIAPVGRRGLLRSRVPRVQGDAEPRRALVIDPSEPPLTRGSPTL